MKIVVIGGSGLIGKKLVNLLRDGGHTAAPASPSTGVNTLTGEGLAEAMAGAQVIVDVANSPSFEDAAALEFFTTSARNLLTEAATAGVGHYIALSVVGAERMSDMGYMRAKVVQEDAIKAGSIPYTIVRATQFFEFIGSVAESYADGDTVRPSSVLMQPIAADDVAAALAAIAVGAPANGMVEIAGPERLGIDEFVRQSLSAKNDPRQIIPNAQAGYFGSNVNDQSLTPGDHPRLGTTSFKEWLSRSRPQMK